MATIAWNQIYTAPGGMDTGYAPPASATPGLARVPVGNGFSPVPQRIAGTIGIEVPVLFALLGLGILMMKFSPV